MSSLKREDSRMALILKKERKRETTEENPRPEEKIEERESLNTTKMSIVQ